MKKILLIFILFISFYSNAQIIWQNTIGGSGPDHLVDLIKTSDGGYLLVGDSYSDISGDKSENSIGTTDYWIVKTDASGIVIWDKTLGGNDSFNRNEPNAVIETKDGGFVIAGSSDSNISYDKSENSKGGIDYWIVKINSNGVKTWDKTIGGDDDDYATSIQETSTGDLIIGGISQSNISGDKTENIIGGYDFWVVKISSLGNIIWDKTFGTIESDLLFFLKVTQDGGYIMGGSNSSNISGDMTDLFGFTDYWIVKVNNTNTIDWQKSYGGSSRSDSYLTDGILTSDGGYLVAGFSDSDIAGNKTVGTKGNQDLWLIKLNNLGLEEWQRDIGGEDGEFSPFLIQKPNGNFVITASSISSISGDKTENNHSLNGGIWGVEGDLWLVEIDSNGIVVGDKTIGTKNDENFGKIVLANDGNFVVGSNVNSLSGDNTEAPVGSFDYWLFKLNQNTLSTPKITPSLNLSIFPVPAINELNISSQQPIDKVEILDIKGREIIKITSQTDKIDVSKLTSGMYLMRIFSEKSFITKRFVKQ